MDDLDHKIVQLLSENARMPVKDIAQKVSLTSPAVSSRIHRLEQEGIINATSTEAIPDLLRAAAAEGADRLVVRVSYFSTDRAGVEQMVRDVQEEKDGGSDAGILAAPWQVSFYPDTDEPGIVEITLK